MTERVLVVAAHPDDEILGCGGAMAKHAAAGDEVRVVIVAEGATSRLASRDAARCQDELAALGDAAAAAARCLGVKEVARVGLPDNRLDGLERLDLVKAIEDKLAVFQPTVVYTHHAGDVNIDHQCVHHAVVTACRPLPGSLLHTLLFFEVASSTEWQVPGSAVPFLPQWFEDISPVMGAKLAAMKCYEAEMRPPPHSRSYVNVEALARWRGACAGFDYAEAFVVGRVRRF